MDIAAAGRAIMSQGRARTRMAPPSMSSMSMSPPSLARGYATPVDVPNTDYAFEVSAANLRFGEGVTVSAVREERLS